MNIFENAKTFIYNYIYNTPSVAQQLEPVTPERIPPNNHGFEIDRYNMTSDIENAGSEEEYEEEEFIESESIEEAEDVTIKMETDSDEDELNPNITLFRGNRDTTEEDEQELAEMMVDTTYDNFLANTSPVEESEYGSEEMDWESNDMKNVTMFRGSRPLIDEEDEVEYFDISDTIDEYTISEMRYHPGGIGAVKGCIVCHYFVDCSLCPGDIIECQGCDRNLDYIFS